MTQPKVLEMREYFVYFPFSELHGWGQKARQSPQLPLCGVALREPHSKAMGDGLFELRIKFSSDISRIFYFFVVDNRIVLTNGFVKKTMKTPKAEIELARKYKADYERRGHSHE